MPGYTQDFWDDVLNHSLGISPWTFPTDVKFSYHLATTLVTAGTATDTSIEVAHEVTTGSKIIVDVNGASPETFWAGTVTENDNTPDPATWTVELLDTNGDPDALANNHDADVYISYDILYDTSKINETDAASYGRKVFSDFSAPQTDGTGTKRLCDNNAWLEFNINTDSLQGLATHICAHHDALDAFAVSEMPEPYEVINGGQVRIPIGTLKFRHSLSTSA